MGRKRRRGGKQKGARKEASQRQAVAEHAQPNTHSSQLTNLSATEQKAKDGGREGSKPKEK